MKKISLLVVIVIISFGCNAQKLDAAKVPVLVKNSFEKAYPGITAKWEKEDGNYEVNFKKDGNTMSAIIDPKGTILETEMDIKTSELPATVLSYVKDHYSGKTIKESAKITKADGTVNYEAEVDGKDLLFDAAGKFIKESKD